MNLAKGVVFCCLFFNVYGFEPFTLTALTAVTTAVVYKLFFPTDLKTKDPYVESECCNARWIHLNTEGLKEDLGKKLYGQPLVSSIILKHLIAHEHGKASRALSLSFHGGTGVGKNYVSKIIAENKFKKGLKSKYVHLISATRDFLRKEDVHQYQVYLQKLIESSVKDCAQSLFIFDEIDRAPPGVLNAIVQYMDYYENLNGVDYRKAIFLFLSNTGGKKITEHTVQRNREDVTLKDMEEIMHNALTEKSESSGGLYGSLVITKHLITAYVPFLPLEERHIKLCIKDHLREEYFKDSVIIPDEKVNEISSQLRFFSNGKTRFSVSGCKRVPEKVAYIMIETD